MSGPRAIIADPGRSAGFTLIEMLVALFVFSIISMGAFAAMVGAIRVQERMQQSADQLSQMEMSRALIRSDMAHMILRPMRDSYGNFETYSLSSGMTSLLSFTRTGRPNPGGLEARSDLQRVNYQMDGQNLVRQVLARENPAPDTPVHSRILYKNVQRAEIVFADKDQEFTRMAVPIEDGQSAVNMMRLEITFTDGRQLIQKFEVDLL